MVQSMQEPVELRLKTGGKVINMKFVGKDAEDLLRVVSKAIYPGKADDPKDEPITSF